ncbi:hypothetical protein I4U23_005437 [Adineta vaga]|nr:hypothetical protein I4U23_005437 [Adineta vaga]
MDDNSYLATLNEFIQITQNIIEKLEEEVRWINRHQKRCNGAKTLGTVTSLLGTGFIIGALALAPITGGISIVAATGYGAVVCGAGAVVNLATDITDMATQNIEKSQVEKICARRNNVANRLGQYFAEIDRVANELRALHIKEDHAYLLSLWNAIKTGNNMRASAEDILQLSRCAQVANGASNMYLRTGGYFWKGMRMQSQGLMKALAFFGFNVSKKAAMTVIRTGTIVLNGAFAIYDIYSLIQSIKSDHLTATAISGIITQMNEELSQMIELRNTALNMLED